MKIYVILVLLEHMQGCKGPALHVLQVVDYMAIEKLSLSLLRYLYTRFQNMCISYIFSSPQRFCKRCRFIHIYT